MSSKVNKKNEEQISNRVLSMFAVGALTLWALAYLYKLWDYMSTRDTGILVTKILLGVSCAGIVAGLIWFFLSKKKGDPRLSKVINGISIASFFALLAVCCLLLLYDYVFGMKLIYIIIPAAVIYYLVFNVYHRNFFWLLLSFGALIGCIYFMSNSFDTAQRIVYAAMGIVVCILSVIISKLSLDKNGSLIIGKSRIVIFEKEHETNFKGIIAIYAVTAAILAACIFVPLSYVMYVLYASIAFVICSAVYFTIRLM